MAKQYWDLPDDASWVLCLKHILADEAHHRDVNHTIADLDGPSSANPFVHEHQGDFDTAAKRHMKHMLEQARVRADSNQEYPDIDSATGPLHPKVEKPK
jgi:hypothetical protein